MKGRLALSALLLLAPPGLAALQEPRFPGLEGRLSLEQPRLTLDYKTRDVIATEVEGGVILHFVGVMGSPEAPTTISILGMSDGFNSVNLETQVLYESTETSAFIPVEYGSRFTPIVVTSRREGRPTRILALMSNSTAAATLATQEVNSGWNKFQRKKGEVLKVYRPGDTAPLEIPCEDQKGCTFWVSSHGTVVTG